MKFISSSYDNATGEATVIMQHLGVKFTGTAKVHPDEKENASELAGCYYAELRATVKALKFEKQMLKDQYKIIKNFVDHCEDYNTFNKTDASALAVYRQLNRRKTAIKKINDEIIQLNLELRKSIIHRSHILHAVKQKSKAFEAFQKALKEKGTNKDN